jgi:hypothetical protein
VLYLVYSQVLAMIHSIVVCEEGVVSISSKVGFEDGTGASTHN